MKRFPIVFLLIVTFLLFTPLIVVHAAPLAQDQQPPVTLPDELVGLISIAVTFLVAEGIKGMVAWFGVDLSGKAAGLTAALTAVVVAFINGLLAFVPVQFSPIAVEILRLVVLLVGAFGAYHVFKQVARNKVDPGEAPKAIK